MRILLAEDEKRMVQALTELLRLEGYEVVAVEDGTSALSHIIEEKYDAVVLDVMMPGLNGLEVVQEARSHGITTPLLLLTAKDTLDDKVAGLDCGADDYLTKPFQTRELLARIRALCRRNTSNEDAVLHFGDITLNVLNATISCTTNGQSVRLGEKEARIMEYMLSNQGQILTRERIALRIWGYENEAEYNNVEVYMSFTRKKLAFIGAETEIKAVRGIGYELRCRNVQ